MKKLIRKFLKTLNKDPEKKNSNTAKAEGYPEYLIEAGKLNMDVNDYLDNNLGWIQPGPVLEKVLYPVLKSIGHPRILELGPGTGRWTRQIIKKAREVNCSEILLVDHSQWMIEFLNSYFNEEKIIKTFRNNGINLPPAESEFDIIFSQGVFIELKPSFIYLYANEFAKVLKPGGYCVFDYFNFESDEGWDYFINESNKGNIYYTFYSDKFIDSIFGTAGFGLKSRYEYGKSKFVCFQKKQN